MSAARTAFVLALALFGALLLRHHWTIVTMPIPLDLYEGTMPLITGIIASGANPYTAAYQPQAADVYPPLYNILVAPLTHVFANPSNNKVSVRVVDNDGGFIAHLEGTARRAHDSADRDGASAETNGTGSKSREARSATACTASARRQ